MLTQALNGPWEKEAGVELGAVVMEVHQFHAARAFMERYIAGFEYEEDVPTKALLLAGRLERRSGNLGRAFELLSAHLASFPDSPEGHYQVGLILEAEGHTEEARKHLRKAGRLEKYWADTWSAKGKRAAEAGHLDTAERYYHKAVRCDPGLAEPYKWMATAYRKAGKYSRMREVIAKMKGNSQADDSNWRRKFRHSATLAQRLGTVLTEEVRLLRESMLARPSS